MDMISSKTNLFSVFLKTAIIFLTSFQISYAQRPTIDSLEFYKSAIYYPHKDADIAVAITFLRDATEKTLADRKSTRLNSSHVRISYAVFCLKKKKIQLMTIPCTTTNPSHPTLPPTIPHTVLLYSYLRPHVGQPYIVYSCHGVLTRPTSALQY